MMIIIYRIQFHHVLFDIIFNLEVIICLYPPENLFRIDCLVLNIILEYKILTVLLMFRKFYFLIICGRFFLRLCKMLLIYLYSEPGLLLPSGPPAVLTYVVGVCG